MKPYVVITSALVCVLAASVASAQTERALLIGINLYQPPGTTADHPAGCIYGRCELGAFQNLDGSVNDAEAMADLLTSPKFGFPAKNVVLLTNPAAPHPRPRRFGASRFRHYARRHSRRHAEVSCGHSAEGRHRGFLRRQSRLAARQQQGQQADRSGQWRVRPCRQLRWFRPTPTKAATTFVIAR